MVLVGLVGLCVLLFLVVLMGRWSLRRSSVEIAQGLKELTPLGTSYERAAAVLERRYSKTKKNEKTGFLLQEMTHQETVGVKSIEVHLGQYFQLPLGRTSVDAFWGFDTNGKLIKVWVWKITDSL